MAQDAKARWKHSSAKREVRPDFQRPDIAGYFRIGFSGQILVIKPKLKIMFASGYANHKIQMRQ